MPEINRRTALVTLALAGLATLSQPSPNSWMNDEHTLPKHFPKGWEALRDYLLVSAKPGRVLRAKPTHSAVYLGNGVALTAAHAQAPEDAIDVRPIRFSFRGGPDTADLLLYRIKDDPNLPKIHIAYELPLPGDPVIHCGVGRHRSTHARIAPGRYLYSCIPEESLLGAGPYHSPLFRLEATPFSKNGAASKVAVGDSGGPVFAFNQKRESWELIGILVSTLEGAVDSTGRPCNVAQAVDLTHPMIRAQILSYVEGR